MGTGRVFPQCPLLNVFVSSVNLPPLMRFSKLEALNFNQLARYWLCLTSQEGFLRSSCFTCPKSAQVPDLKIYCS